MIGTVKKETKKTNSKQKGGKPIQVKGLWRTRNTLRH